ncbi:MAG: PTS sugar transporter subunit IIA [Pseudomonadota bacterium]
MNLPEILNPKAIKVTGAHSSKKRLLMVLGDMAEEAYTLPSNLVIDALLERESLGPTGVGHGVALPHARIDGLQGVVGAFVRLDKAIDFGSVDRQPVDLIFCLLASQKAGVDHLKALATVSRTMRDPAVCAKLRANSDPAILHAILTETPTSEAA